MAVTPDDVPAFGPVQSVLFQRDTDDDARAGDTGALRRPAARAECSSALGKVDVASRAPHLRHPVARLRHGAAGWRRRHADRSPPSIGIRHACLADAFAALLLRTET